MFLGTHIQIPCSSWQTVLLSTSYTMSKLSNIVADTTTSLLHISTYTYLTFHIYTVLLPTLAASGTQRGLLNQAVQSVPMQPSLKLNNSCRYEVPSQLAQSLCTIASCSH